MNSNLASTSYKRYAKQSSEILIKRQINGKEVKILSESDIEAIKKDTKQQATIKSECKSGRAHK
ncbi:hypothetical protein [Clostridium saccharobutylicum]|uniref:Uncharacterized protein n=1 Tax=Clostridium saccharobutylicum TaxID=169679 RepID=A0A1S8N5B7_CLOSA|nr:hypothetical protein [Clostridium saccharobutylicum]OOM11716.1 hypothetical protein CLOSAC_21430 [Clostridium saccharobutylicum]